MYSYMIRPNVYLAIVRRANIDSALLALDGYEFPLTIIDSSSAMSIDDCIDDEDGTLDF